MYFINGMFWQQGQMPYIIPDPNTGSVITIGESQAEATFSGLIGEHSLASGYDGFLVDIFGKSVIAKFVHEETKISFFAQHERQLSNDNFLISYTFSKSKNEIWEGTWRAPAVGGGEARCILTPIPDDFFLKSR
jgi:hypothetical protein